MDEVVEILWFRCAMLRLTDGPETAEEKEVALAGDRLG